MVRSHADQAANERSFRAWVHPAIAVMAFGLLVERIDVFLVLVAPSLADRSLRLPGQQFGNADVLALIVVGAAIVVIAAARFLVTVKAIDSAGTPYGTFGAQTKSAGFHPAA